MGVIMRRSVAATGSAVFFAVAPAMVAGGVPWLITHWAIHGSFGHNWPLRALGVVLVAAAGIVLLQAFARFALEGRGTPAPVAPTERLVVGGLYRYVRNPMYLAVVAAVVGQALLLDVLELLWYAGLLAIIFALFVRGYEEPTLQEQFGEEYAAYRRAVRRWLPRLSPWRPDVSDRPDLR
jgi:protein-S-isoprenylcysteine O-methyltransferase Ste14